VLIEEWKHTSCRRWRDLRCVQRLMAWRHRWSRPHTGRYPCSRGSGISGQRSAPRSRHTLLRRPAVHSSVRWTTAATRPNKHAPPCDQTKCKWISRVHNVSQCPNLRHDMMMLMAELPLCALLQFHCYPCRSTTLRSQDELSCTAPTTWNSLPSIVTAADSMTSFKSRLKTHLLNQTFRPIPS